MKCEYCAKFGNDNLLEHLPNKKSYYCKRCGNYFGEDEIKTKEQTKAGGFPLTVVKETHQLVDDTKEMLKSLKEDKTGLRVGGIPKGALDKNKSKK